MKSLSILIIDDEPDNFDVIETFLSEGDTNGQAYNLHYSDHGQNIANILQIFKPDLILLDVMMPKVDGLTVCQQIKALREWQHIPIIMITALSSKLDLARCLQAGADDFISKPVNSLELRARVQSMLRIKQQYDEIQSLVQIQENTIAILQQSMNALRGNLASTLPHELNTPLNGILGMLDILKEDFESMDQAEIEEILGMAYGSALRLESITKKFIIYLELELLSSQAQPLQSLVTEFMPTKVESNLRKLADVAHRQGDLHLALNPAKIAISDRYLSIICSELVDNAIKFSTPLSPIKVSSEVKGDRFYLSVEDVGRGMTESQITQISAFIQFDRKTYEQQGLGLGLKIVSQIVELAKGQLIIHSIYGQQTTVQVILPLPSSS